MSSTERIAWLKAKLKEMSVPGYYGCWCAGYMKRAYQEELKKLEDKAGQSAKK
jgi:hypothetical protein